MGSNDQSGGGSFLFGLLLGGAIGAVVALLYAPQRGDEARDLLTQKTTDVANAAKQKATEVSGQIKQTAGEYSDKASAVVDDLKAKSADTANTVASKAQDAATTVKDTAQDLTNKGKTIIDQKSKQVQEAVGAYKDGFSDKKQELKGVIAGDDSEAGA